MSSKAGGVDVSEDRLPVAQLGDDIAQFQDAHSGTDEWAMGPDPTTLSSHALGLTAIITTQE